jgi:hypothetical protein
MADLLHALLEAFEDLNVPGGISDKEEGVNAQCVYQAARRLETDGCPKTGLMTA